MSDHLFIAIEALEDINDKLREELEDKDKRIKELEGEIKLLRLCRKDRIARIKAQAAQLELLTKCKNRLYCKVRHIDDRCLKCRSADVLEVECE